LFPEKCTETLRRVLSGELDMKDAHPAIQSWARFSIYQGAKEVLGLSGTAARRKALAGVPALIRPYIENEVKRLWQAKK